MSLTLRDRLILLAVAFVICIYGGYKMLWIPAEAKITQLEENKIIIEGQAGDITPLRQQSEKLKKEVQGLKERVDNIKNLSGGFTTTNEEFLVFLGSSAKRNNVAVSGFNDLGTTAEDGIYRTVFDFELKGSSDDINKVLDDIDNIGIKCSCGSISYRQNEQFDYLKRFFDNISDLPWYTEPEEEIINEPEITEPEFTEPEPFLPEITPDIEPGIFDVPNVTPSIEPEIPDTPKETLPPSEPSVKEEKPKTIEERIEDLLKQTKYDNRQYRGVYLSKTSDNKEFKSGRDMRLAVTVCFIMYNKPSTGTSFMTHMESESNAVF